MTLMPLLTTTTTLMMIMMIKPPANVCPVPGKHESVLFTREKHGMEAKEGTEATGMASNHVEVIRLCSVILPLAVENCFAASTVTLARRRGKR